ncbi:MAG: STAS domain-containing protein [Gemmatimonadales bacterium]|nr:STAS domain-containing protein [Gemmatimonadales bacterium]
MEVTVERQASAAVARISGSVDGLTAEALQAALQAPLDEGVSRLVADLSGVEYTSSAGLRVLLGTLKLSRQKGGDFRLAAVRPNVLKVLELSGFTSILKVYEDVEGAVASFGE